MRRTKSGLPKHCSWNTDRHGKRRVRFRKSGFTTYLVGTPWSEEFMRHYAAALDGVKAQAINIGAGRTVAGTVNALVAAYLDPASTSPFKTLAAETKRSRRNILENFRESYGSLPLYRSDKNGRRAMLLTREHVQRIVNAKSATPFAQRNFLHALHAVFKWALSEGRIPDDPTLGVTRVKARSTGYRTWSEQDIERFEARHPIGTKARLAFALLLYTGQRRGDVLRMGPRDVHDGFLTIDQSKTEGQPEAHVEIPVHPKLCEIIDATATVGVNTFLVTNSARRTPPRGLATGSVSFATRQTARSSQPTACARPLPAGSPSSVARCIKSRPFSATPPWPWCNFTQRPPTASAWRRRR